MKTYAITGIREALGPGPQVPLRREIDEWWFSKNENDLNQRSLFIYALQKFMSMLPDDPSGLSYFSIAGTSYSTKCSSMTSKLTNLPRYSWASSYTMGQ